MSRARPTDYAGATASSKLKLADVPSLDSRWAIQPKLDGWYATLHTDRTGRVRHVLSRSGQTIPLAMAGHLFGAWMGWPDSVLHGELVGDLVHAFDCSQADGVRVADRPYSERRDVLWRMQSEVVSEQPERSWTPIEGLRARDRASGQYTRAQPEDWRLVQVIDQAPIARWSTLWERALTGDGIEGLVLVRQDAKLGARGSKVKVKPVNTIDATVVRVDRGGLLAYVAADDRLVALGHRSGLEVRVGDVVELAHEGRYASGELRFARVARTRPDLAPVVPMRLAV